MPGWHFAAGYQAGQRGAEVGGDFYDSFPVAGGHMVLLGDVTGKGVRAAALTSLVRYTARTAAGYDPTPSAVLARVNRALRERPLLAPVTMLVALLRDGGALLGVGGHPLPLLRRAAGGAEPVGRTGMLLGAVHDYELAEDVAVPLAPGEVLLLYTDGVTDTPGEHDRFGDATAARRAGRRPARPGRRPRRRLRRARRVRDRRHAGRPGDARGAARVSLAADANAGRIALVTGGGSGIGRATALAFARSGARVAVCGRRPEPLEETRALVEAAGGECLAVAADIREPDAVGALVGAVLDRFGTVDVLVNNAGGQFVAPAEEISDNGWRAVERVTVDATWTVTRTVAERAMIPGRGGLIVFIGFSPRRGTPGMAHAAAGRAAVENLAAGLALEWSRHRIRSVCVAPGSIRSEGLDGYDPELVAGWERSIPLGRLGRAEEVASVIAFLASAGGAYITGTTIVVDGGADAWGMGEPPPPVEGGA